MLGSIRNALVAGLVVALGTLGVSLAATHTPGGDSSSAGGSAGAPASPGSAAEDVRQNESHQTGSPAVDDEQQGPTRSTDGCDGFTPEEGKSFNHGQYVSSQPKNGEARSAAAQSPCGKPEQAVQEQADDETPEAPEVENQNEEHGGPPAGPHGHSDEHGNQGEAHSGK